MIDVKLTAISKIHRILLCHEIHAEKAIAVINQRQLIWTGHGNGFFLEWYP